MNEELKPPYQKWEPSLLIGEFELSTVNLKLSTSSNILEYVELLSSVRQNTIVLAV